MKIGKVYADAEREEDRADQALIEMGVIVGEGALGAAVEAVQKLVKATSDYGYYHDRETVRRAERGIETAWMELFAALKTIEAQAETEL